MFGTMSTKSLIGILIFLVTAGVFVLEVSVHSGVFTKAALRVREMQELEVPVVSETSAVHGKQERGEEVNKAAQQLVEAMRPSVIHRWANASDSVIIVTRDGVLSADDESLRKADYAQDTKRLQAFRTKKGLDLKALTFKDSAERFKALSAANGQGVSPSGERFMIYRPVEAECAHKLHTPDSADWLGGSEMVRRGRLAKCIQNNKDSTAKFLVDSCVIIQYYFDWDPWIPLGATKPRRRAFMESGGLAGLPSQSMTLVFQQYFGYDAWDGMTVEATAANFAHLLVNRPCLYRTEVAAGKEWEQLDFTGWGGCCSGITADMAEKNKRVFHGVDAESYKVQAAPMTEILLAAGFENLDFWVLDVEGAELSVLLGMDFKKINVGMILVEISGNEDTAAQVHELLLRSGFFLDTRHFHSLESLNSLYIHANSEAWIMDRYNLSAN